MCSYSTSRPPLTSLAAAPPPTQTTFPPSYSKEQEMLKERYTHNALSASWTEPDGLMSCAC